MIFAKNAPTNLSAPEPLIQSPPSNQDTRWPPPLAAVARQVFSLAVDADILNSDCHGQTFKQDEQIATLVHFPASPMVAAPLAFRTARQMPPNMSCCILGPGGAITETGDRAIYPLYSITKTLIAALLMRSGVDVHRPVADWIDAAILPHGTIITLEHLLTHTSGLRDYGALPAYQRSVAKGGPAWDDATFAQATLHEPLLFDPGAAFSYANPGYWLLKTVLERETGHSFATLIDREIAEPLNLESFRVASGIFSEALPTYEAGWVWHGLVLGNARDTATFMRSSLTAALASTRVHVPGAGPLYARAAYGYGVMTNHDASAYGHNGGGPGFSTACFHAPAAETTIAVLMAHDGPDDRAYQHLQEMAKDRQVAHMAL